jgi:hypothetical protein
MNLHDIISKHKIDFPVKYRNNCINDIYEYFEKDNWCKAVPKYQTWPILFERTDEHWQFLKNSLLQITSFSHIRAWAYVSFVGKDSGQGDNPLNNLWHKHTEGAKSALFYLSCKPLYGTLFLTNNFLISPVIDESCWYLFDSSLYHAPHYWNHLIEDKNRICLAVEYT